MFNGAGLMKNFFQLFCGCLGAGAFGLLWGWLFWLGVVMDDEELKAGKSPHSGFCPDSPTWEEPDEVVFDGLDKPSRTGSGTAQNINQQ